MNAELPISDNLTYKLEDADNYKKFKISTKDANIIGTFEISNISEADSSCFFKMAVDNEEYQKEALSAMLSHAKDDLDLSRQNMKVYSDDFKMVTLARKLGFTIEGVMRASKKVDGKWVDELLFAHVEKDRVGDSHLNRSCIVEHAADMIGNTPFIDLSKYFGCDQEVFAKIESFNPGASIKDRTAFSIIDEARKKGQITEGGTVIEATSGNTAAGLALVASKLGYNSMAVAPEGSIYGGKLSHLKALGSLIVEVPGVGNFAKAVEVAEELHRIIPNSFLGNQFANSDNPLAHVNTTAKEIISHLGQVECLIASMGTGGTLMGNSQALKKAYGELKCIAVEPKKCSVLTGGEISPHSISGIGPGFMPDIVDKDMFDNVITVSDEDAANEAINFCKETGFFVGISSGAVLCGIREAINKGMFKKSAVAILADSGLKYGGENCFYINSLDELHSTEGRMISMAEGDSVDNLAGKINNVLNASRSKTA